MRCVMDCESNGFVEEATKMWCVVFKNIDTKEIFKFAIEDEYFRSGYLPLSNLKTFMEPMRLLICHNLIDFDLRLLKKLLDVEPPKNCVIRDTLIQSRLQRPERKHIGGLRAIHSLEAWGLRSKKLKKIEVDDWTINGPDKMQRCVRDVEINEWTYYRLEEEAKKLIGVDFTFALKLEHRVQEIATRQRLKGVLFNDLQAEVHVTKLKADIEETDQIILPIMSQKIVQDGVTCEGKFYLKNSGELKKKYVKFWGDRIDEWSGGAFSRLKFKPININSDHQLRDALLRQGWNPLEYTPTGLPKITEESLDLIEHLSEIGKALNKRNKLCHRKGQIQGWLDVLRDDGRVPAGGNPLGTPTRRWTHKILCNVPRVTSFFGKEERSLFIVPKGKVMVGCDASGLENRMLGHEANDPEFTAILISDKKENDFHSKIQKILSRFITDRDTAKTWEYAFFYGAGPLKLGSIVNEPFEYSEDQLSSMGWVPIDSSRKTWRLYPDQDPLSVEGASLYGTGRITKELVMRGLPSFKNLNERLIQQAKVKGYLHSVDGAAFMMRRGEGGQVQTHKALNTRLQGNGAVVMKLAKVLLDTNLRKNNIGHHQAEFIIDQHDEWQLEVDENVADKVAYLARQAIIGAGKYFKLNIPLDAESKIGLNWAQTH